MKFILVVALLCIAVSHAHHLPMSPEQQTCSECLAHTSCPLFPCQLVCELGSQEMCARCVNHHCPASLPVCRNFCFPSLPLPLEEETDEHSVGPSLEDLQELGTYQPPSDSPYRSQPLLETCLTCLSDKQCRRCELLCSASFTSTRNCIICVRRTCSECLNDCLPPYETERRLDLERELDTYQPPL